MRVYLFAACLALTACATETTGVVPIGTGGFMISKTDPMARFGGQLKAELMQEAAAHCARQGKQFSPTSSHSEDPVVYQKAASAEVQFRCT